MRGVCGRPERVLDISWYNFNHEIVNHLKTQASGCMPGHPITNF